MKSENLLTGLSEVGEDLLAETESGIRVSTKRPRAWAAIAAGLAVLVGLGGLAFWQARKHLKKAPADPAATVTMSDPEKDPGELERLWVDFYWQGESAWSFDNLERSLAVNRWTLETGANRLPVYEVATQHPDLEGWTWEGKMDQSLRVLLNEAAARLGLPAPEEVRILEDGCEIASVEADTEMGLLSVDVDGRVRILFDEDHRLSATVKIDFAEEPTVWERDAAYRDAVMEQCGEQVAELLGLPPCHPAVCDRYSSLSSGYTAYLLYPIREDPAEQIKSRNFEVVRMLTVGGREVLGLEWTQLPEAGETCAVPADWRYVGNYPIISAEAAKQAALQGAYYCKASLSPLVTEENLAWGELVYLSDYKLAYLLPFYRFWVPLREGEVTSLMDCAAVYVPAVDPDYLNDYPKKQPEVIDDPGLAPFAVGDDYLNTADESGIAIIDLSTMNYLESPGTSLPTPLWGDLAERYDTLPVYRYLAVGERYLTRGRMEELGTEAAELLDMEIDGFAYYQEDMDRPVAAPEPDETLVTLTVKLKNGGLIWVRGNGQIIYISPSAISAEEAVDPADPDAVFAVFARQLLQLEHTEDYAAQFGVGPAYPNLYFFPQRTDEKQALLAYHFEMSVFSKTGDSSVAALCCSVLPNREMDPSAPSQPGEAFELMGEYPIISREEARELAAKGYYYSATGSAIYHDPVFFRQGETPDFTLCDADAAELVYPSTAMGMSVHETVLPFYRFWFVAGEGTDSMEAYPVYVPAIDPAYLTDFPSAESDDPTHDDPGVEETDDPDDKDPTLKEGFFTAVYDAERTYFTDGQKQYWLEDSDVLEKDLNSGETRTLFSLEPDDKIRTELVGVTAQRLYFGWMYTDDGWGGLNVYSVDHQNRDRTELGERQEVTCRDGWILLESHRTDVSMSRLQVIDHDDSTVLTVQKSWGGAVVDGRVWYIYAPILQEDGAVLESLSPEERDEALQNMEYEVCLLERDGDTIRNSCVYTITQNYFAASFRIDPEAREIRGECIKPIPLDSLKPVAENPGNTRKTISLARCFGNNGEEAKLFRDVEIEIALSPISDFDRKLPAELPIYKNLAYVDASGIPVYLSREEMAARAYALAQRWKLEVQSTEWIDGALPEGAAPGQEPNPSALRWETDKATVTVYGNGEQTVFFREPLDKDTELAAEWIYDPDAPLTPESAAAYAKAWADYCEGCDGLMVQCEPVYGYADMDARTYTCIYYLTEPADSEEITERKQRLLEYTFHEQLYLDEHGNLTGYRTHLTTGSGLRDNYAAELLDSYPILSKAEADQALVDGFFVTNADIPLFQNGKALGEALLEHTVAAELVYRTGNDEYFLPYYRYWVVSDEPKTAGELTRCAAVYVPAVSREYLTDWPEYLMPALANDGLLSELKALFEDESSFYGRILRCGAFPSPDLVPLGNLLNYGLPGVDNTLSPEEWAEVKAAATAEQLDSGVEPVKLPRTELNALLKRTLGLTLDQIQYNDLRAWVYLESRDCYYLFGGDQGGVGIEVESYIVLADNELQLRYWRMDDGPDKPALYTANLRRTADGYIVLNNEPAVWNN